MLADTVLDATRGRRVVGAATAVSLLVLTGCSSGGDATATTPLSTETSSTMPAPTVVVTTAATATTSTAAEQTTTAIDDEAVRLTFVIEDGSVNGIDRFAVSLGAMVVLTIKSDAADEVHLHGYDVMIDLEPGVPAELAFTADIPGIFEMELETARILITEVQVAP